MGLFDGWYQCFICKEIFEVTGADLPRSIAHCSEKCQKVSMERGIMFPFIRPVKENEMKKFKVKKPESGNAVTVNSKAWKELRAAAYRRRLAVPSGVKPEDVPFQKKAMDEVDKLPVSEGGKGKQ